jgi:glycine/D-amino acid oxidase-like deaminating enzyme
MKGEILDLIIPDFYQDRVFIRGGFLIPFGNSHYRAGATYDGKNINEEVTEEAETNVLQRLEKYLKADYSVNKQFAGVRPAVKDRRPLLGTHPLHPNVHLFNGFGSKGSSLAPLMANQFIDSIENGRSIPEECDLQRFRSMLAQ